MLAHNPVIHWSPLTPLYAYVLSLLTVLQSILLRFSPQEIICDFDNSFVAKGALLLEDILVGLEHVIMEAADVKLMRNEIANIIAEFSIV